MPTVPSCDAAFQALMAQLGVGGIAVHGWRCRWLPEESHPANQLKACTVHSAVGGQGII